MTKQPWEDSFEKRQPATEGRGTIRWLVAAIVFYAVVAAIVFGIAIQ